MENKIHLDLGEKSYDILVENGAILGLSGFLGDDYSKIFVICDRKVDEIHGLALENALAGRDFDKICVDAGEKAKSFANLEAICEEILTRGVDRKSLIIAFGGGCIGDLAGFVASILLRGVDFVQVPTTLLAMVDSSVGGKTAINARAGKNLVGSFYQPKLVICDLAFLASLPRREVHAGYAEVLKYGIIADVSFFEFLEGNFDEIFALKEDALRRAILRSCEIKAEIVAMDEREAGVRALLNFGHSFAHVFEAEFGYDGRLNHGEAVGVGMLMAAKMSRNLGFLSDVDFERVVTHIKKTGLDIDLAGLGAFEKGDLVRHLQKDKKNTANSLNFVLIDGVGSAFVEKGVAVEEFLRVV